VGVAFGHQRYANESWVATVRGAGSWMLDSVSPTPIGKRKCNEALLCTKPFQTLQNCLGNKLSLFLF
jgi:hypothetical protein